ncbi:MAG: RHS repeat-associated core domain-containing protein [Phycisphaerales bacterium]|nr:RHS repeat-associated core domain-containing protein [Phycisphaerales bacterium]
MWSDWLLLMELDGLQGNAVLRKYTWGLDLAGLNGAGASGGAGVLPAGLTGAGGIGGLLAVYDTNGTTTGQNPEADDMSYAYLYNANGDVGQVVDPNAASAAASLVARYEYDPYGGVTALSGSYAARNAMRFSTKPFDPATGLGYWGYRWYSAKLGRWVSRDPIEEEGGVNLIAFVRNDPIYLQDGLGLDVVGRGGPGRSQCKSSHTPIKPRCADCASRCRESGAQTALGQDEGGVVCFPDGCVCACTNDSRHDPRDYEPAATAIRDCVRTHEEIHIDQQGIGLTFCLTDTNQGGPPRIGYNPEDRRTAECEAYGAEVLCLAAKLSTCPDQACRDKVVRRMKDVVGWACGSYHGLECSSLSLRIPSLYSLPDDVRKKIVRTCK